jgi:hypothetical protein
MQGLLGVCGLINGQVSGHETDGGLLIHPALFVLTSICLFPMI